jgi:hypothetical protein
VANVLEILRAGMTETLNAIDCAAVTDITPDHVVVPAGFTRAPTPAHV